MLPAENMLCDPAIVETAALVYVIADPLKEPMVPALNTKEFPCIVVKLPDVKTICDPEIVDIAAFVYIARDPLKEPIVPPI